jgi:hypothetical protein
MIYSHEKVEDNVMKTKGILGYSVKCANFQTSAGVKMLGIQRGEIERLLVETGGK